MSTTRDFSWEEFDANRPAGPGRPTAAPKPAGFYAKSAANTQALINRLKAQLPASALKSGAAKSAKKTSNRAHTTNLAEQHRHNQRVAAREAARVKAQRVAHAKGLARNAAIHKAGRTQATDIRAARLAAAQRLIRQRTP